MHVLIHEILKCVCFGPMSALDSELKKNACFGQFSKNKYMFWSINFFIKMSYLVPKFSKIFVLVHKLLKNVCFGF